MLFSWNPRRKRPPTTPPRSPRRKPFRPTLERLEDRRVLTILLNSSYTGLDSAAAGGGEPPDSNGAAGPTSYIETVNQTLAIYSPKASGTQLASDSFDDFWFTQGGLPRASSSSGLSDPVIIYDDQPGVGRFVIGDQDVDFTNHVSRFDIAVSKTSDPASLTAADWNFYSIVTTETNEDADYPGNLGFNHDAFVFTLNMFAVSGTSGTNHVQVNSVNIQDLVNGVPPASLGAFQNDFNGFSLRPTTMHDDTQTGPGDPMWLIEESGTNNSINVVQMTNVLSSSPTFATTTLAVNPYLTVVPPLNPNGSVITSNIDSRILKSAEANDTIVATHQISTSATEDDARWYEISVAGGTPVLVDQGNVSAGNNTYVTYPSIDINSAGNIGMTFMRSGTDAATDFMSVYITGRSPLDAAGTMQAPILVQAGQATYSGTRAGDISGINVDADGSFWVVNEWANTNPSPNWGTAIANFALFGITAITPPNATEGIPTTPGPIATFSASGAVTDFTATVDWGDGTTDTITGASGGIVANPDGSFSVIAGPHTYAEEGTYSLKVTVSDTTGNVSRRTVKFRVNDAALNGTPTTFGATVGQPLGSTVVAFFTDTNPLGTLSDFSADVFLDQGSGSSVKTAGQIVHLHGTTFEVIANSSVTFATGGLHDVTVVVHDVGGASVTIHSTANVANNPYIPPHIPLYGADAVPAAFFFLQLQNTLTNLLAAEAAFLQAFGAGGSATSDSFLNLSNAVFQYFAYLSRYQALLPIGV